MSESEDFLQSIFYKNLPDLHVRLQLIPGHFAPNHDHSSLLPAPGIIMMNPPRDARLGLSSTELVRLKIQWLSRQPGPVICLALGFPKARASTSAHIELFEVTNTAQPYRIENGRAPPWRRAINLCSLRPGSRSHRHPIKGSEDIFQAGVSTPPTIPSRPPRFAKPQIPQSQPKTGKIGFHALRRSRSTGRSIGTSISYSSSSISKNSATVSFSCIAR